MNSVSVAKNPSENHGGSASHSPHSSGKRGWTVDESNIKELKLLEQKNVLTMGVKDRVPFRSLLPSKHENGPVI